MTPELRFRWLSRFAEMDASAWGAVRNDVWPEVVAFSWLSVKQFSPRSVAQIFAQAMQAAPGTGTESLAQDELTVAQSDAARTLNDLRKTRRIFPDFPVSEAVWTEDGHIVALPGGDARQRFRAAIFAILTAVAPRLAACADPSCGRLFIKRGRRAYCRTACSQRVRTARYREGNTAAVSDARHARYTRKRRAKLGNRVKVERRPGRGGRPRRQS